MNHGSRTATFLDLEALEIVRGAEQVWNNGEDWLLCLTHQQPGGVWATAGNMFSADSCQNRRLLTHHSKPGKILDNATENALETSCPKNDSTGYSALHVHRRF